jgi:hypothetical protein
MVPCIAEEDGVFMAERAKRGATIGRARQATPRRAVWFTAR